MSPVDFQFRFRPKCTTPLESRGMWLLLGLISLLAGSVWAAVNQQGEPQNDEIAVIESEAHCVDSAGIPINSVPDNEVKVACLQDAKVRMTCDLDGQRARLQAFRQWETALVTFQEQCQQSGGAFSFASSSFREPADETYCTTAEPEVHYSALESPICNFVSHCPRVQVYCRRQEEPSNQATHTVLLPGIPKAVPLSY